MTAARDSEITVGWLADRFRATAAGHTGDRYSEVAQMFQALAKRMDGLDTAPNNPPPMPELDSPLSSTPEQNAEALAYLKARNELITVFSRKFADLADEAWVFQSTTRRARMKQVPYTQMAQFAASAVLNATKQAQQTTSSDKLPKPQRNLRPLYNKDALAAGKCGLMSVENPTRYCARAAGHTPYGEDLTHTDQNGQDFDV